MLTAVAVALVAVSCKTVRHDVEAERSAYLSQEVSEDFLNLHRAMAGGATCLGWPAPATPSSSLRLHPGQTLVWADPGSWHVRTLDDRVGALRVEAIDGTVWTDQAEPAPRLDLPLEGVRSRPFLVSCDASALVVTALGLDGAPQARAPIVLGDTEGESPVRVRKAAGDR